MYTRELTRAYLEECGFKEVIKDSEAMFGYRLIREWKITGTSKKKVVKQIKISCNTTKHKYGKDKSYPIIAWSVGNKSRVSSLSRFLYAWFKGEVPQGLVVDHIDNNSFNNDIDNLQLLTVQENLLKRFTDDDDNCTNQHVAMKRGR